MDNDNIELWEEESLRLMDEDSLEPEQIAELERRIKDLECKDRFVIANDCTFLGILYFDAENSTYCGAISTGTHFKKERYAEAVAKELRGKHEIIKITSTKVK